MNMAKRQPTRFEKLLAPVAFSLAIGIVIGWCLHAWGPPRPALLAVATDTPATDAIDEAANEASHGPPSEPVITTAAPPSPLEGRPLATIGAVDADTVPDGAIDILRRRHLRMPIDGVAFESLKGEFSQRRTGSGGHVHEAVDMLAPRNTPIHAVEAGTIAKLFDSKAGGHTIYQFDPSEQFTYYYAHLDHYADGLHQGQKVSAGDVIGYVGTSGNAPPNTPHLHFTIFELGSDKRWWEGRPVDPYLVFRR